MEYSIKPNSQVPYEISYEDETVLVVHKPAGVVTQPGKRHERDSLLNGLFAEYGHALQNLGESRDWGLLHRLDKDTSGLVIVALRNKAYDSLRKQFEERQVKKTYWAIVWGHLVPAQGVIQKPIMEVTGLRKKAVINQRGMPAITAYRVLARADEVSLVEARPKTGRLHQIRVHLLAMGCPILGETDYPCPRGMPRVSRLCLHAAELSFIHPDGNRRVNVSAPCPSDWRGTLKRFGLPLPNSAAEGDD